MVLVNRKKGNFPLSNRTPMMIVNDNFLSQLASYRQQLSIMQAIPCDLKHEEVRLNNEGRPVKLGHPDVTSYERLGFCNAELRHSNITCAHTQSRNIIRQALAALKKTDPDSIYGYEALEDQLNALEDTIHQLDILKGDEDKSLAILLEQGPAKDIEDINEIQVRIEDIKLRHREKVTALDQLKRKVILEIDRALK
ncbi:hypothetical protein C900_01395 [Fulvivirga imtechensis AK7]|uniref:Uncharacterized protein n=2 Tax=Fulvivirga TaxID=396811 RepID=L8JYE2_9BACT|nr:hypothetical protein C900_01395 [Fulvivirga imtechensis AK7]